MNLILKYLRLSLFTFFVISFAGCANLFNSNVTGIWIISGFGSGTKMQLQQSNTQVIGYAYVDGQSQGQVVGQINGSNITLQLRSSYSPVITYTGSVSSDGNSMQLTAQDGKQLTLFKTG